MKRQFVAVIVFGLVLLAPVSAFARVSQDKPTQAKEADPFPQVPRITAEEVQRLAKDGGKVVLVGTDDPVAFESEHIKGAVNVSYDLTRDTREQDQILSALPRDGLIVFYCNCSHEEDSAPMAMWELGYDHDMVKALKGGPARWEHLKLPLAGSDVNPSAPTKPGNQL
jgi:rhodanese-related sulfurtransferase